MVSTNTPLNGAGHRNNTLIFQQNSAEHHNAIAYSAQGLSQLILKSFVLLSLLLFSFNLFGQQCNLVCPAAITVELNSGSTTSIPTQQFYGGTCNPAPSVSPASATCTDITTGANPPLTVVVTYVPAGGGATQTLTCPNVVQVNDTEAPDMIYCPADATVVCGASTAVADLGQPTFSDNCGGTLTPVFAEVSLMPEVVGICDTLQRTWTVTDASGNDASCVQKIMITNSDDPVLKFDAPTFASGAPSDMTLECDTDLPGGFDGGITTTAEDDCTVVSPFNVTPKDTVVGKTANPCEYMITRTWTAIDDCNNTDVHVQTFTIKDTEGPVFMAPLSPITAINANMANCQGEVVNMDLLDNTYWPANNLADCSNSVQGFWKVYLVTPTGNTFVTQGTGFNANGLYNAGIYDFEFTAIDACMNDNSETYRVTINDTGNPIAVCKNDNITVDSEQGFTIITGAMLNNGSYDKDDCTDVSLLTFEVVGNDRIDCNDALSGTPVSFTLKVTDGNGNSATCNSMITALYSEPTMSCLATYSVDLNPTTNTYALSAADMTALEAGFVDMCNTFTVSYAPNTFNCDNIGDLDVTITVTHNSNGSIKSNDCVTKITVNDVTAPALDCAATFTAYLDEDGEVDLDAALLLDGNPAIYMSSGNSGSGTNGITQYIYTAPDALTLDFDWNYSTNDARGAQEDRFRYRVLTTPPTSPNPWIDLTSGATLNATGSESISLQSGDRLVLQLISTDNMDGRAELKLDNFSPALGTYGTDNFYTEWTPRFIRSDGKAFIAGDAIEGIDCTSLYDLILSTDITSLKCDSIATSPIDVIISATDASGNTSNCTVAVTVEDKLKPTFTCEDIFVPLDENGDAFVEAGWLLAGDKAIAFKTKNDGSWPDLGEMDYTIRVKSTGSLSFRWDFVSQDTLNAGEEFGYLINGNYTKLNTNVNQLNRPRTISVTQGDILTFRMITDNDVLEAHAAVRPTNFTLENDFAPYLWERAITDTDGTVFIHGEIEDNCSGPHDIKYLINSMMELDLECLDLTDLTAMPPVDPIQVNATFEDQEGNIESCMSYITVLDNEPPIAVCPSSYSVTLNSNGEVNLDSLGKTKDIINDSDDNCTVDSVSTMPAILTCADIQMNANGDPIPVTVSYTVFDAAGNSATCTNNITVQEGTPPQITCPAGGTVQCEDLPANVLDYRNGMATASDNCGMTTITPSVDSMASMKGCYEIVITWEAEDESGNTSSCDQIIVVEDDDVPVLEKTGCDMAGMNCDQDNVTVDCESDVLAIADPMIVDECSATLNTTIVDDRLDADGKFLATAEVGMPGHYDYTVTRTWQAEDACGQTSTMLTQVVTVEDNEAPVISANTLTSIAQKTDIGRCDAMVNLALTAADITDCVPFQYLDITNDSPVGNGEEDASGRYPLGTTVVTFTIKDLNGNPVTHEVTVQVNDDTTPQMFCNASVLPVNLDSDGYARISFNQIDNNSYDICTGITLSVAPFEFDCGDIGMQTVTLTGTDVAGNSATCTAVIDVDRGSFNGAAALDITCPANMTVNCEDDYTATANGAGIPTFSSNCSNGMLSTPIDNPALLSPTCGLLERTWTVTDGTASKSCTQEITIVDNEAPTFVTATPNNVVVECDNIPAALDLEAEDNCRNNWMVASDDSDNTKGALPNMSSYYNYIITRKWIAEDGCVGVSGSTTTATTVDQRITVRDRVAPVVNFPNPMVISTGMNSCDTLVDFDLKSLINEISDNCADIEDLMFTINNGPVGNSTISQLMDVDNSPYSFTITVDDPSSQTGAVTAVLNIEIKDETDPSAICEDKTINLGGNSTATINPVDFASASTDNCTAQNMLDITADQVVFTSADIGSVSILLTVEDEAGNTTTCTSNSTVIDGTLITAQDLAIEENMTDNLPIVADQFINVTSFGFNVEVTDIAVGDVMNLVNINSELSTKGTFNFNPTAAGNGYSVLWTATSNSNPATIADGGSLFELEIDATGADGTSTPVVISNASLMRVVGGGAPIMGNLATDDGELSVFSATSIYTFDVEVNTEETFPVANVDVVQTGATTDMKTTNSMGDAVGFMATSGSTATFTPTKNTGWKNGVTVNDAFLTLQHPNPTSTFGSGYKNIAADANGDNIITGNDAILIFQLAVDPAFTSIPGNTSWRFIHESPLLPNLDFSFISNPWGLFTESYTTTVTVDELVKFVGVKTGDVDADANALLRQNGTFEFLLENQSIENTGERVEVEFKAKDFKGINGYQYTIDFESKLLEYIDVIPGVLPNLSSFNFKDAKAADGQLTTGYINIDAVDLNDNDVLFTLVFESQAANFELKDVIKASNNLIPMQVIESTGELKNEVELIFESSTSSTVNTFENNLDLRQNVPNPFDNETIVGFTLPDATAVQLNFMDASGKLLHTIDSDYPQGYHEVTVSKNVLPTTGVVFYQLQTEFGTKVQKMIILE